MIAVLFPLILFVSLAHPTKNASQTINVTSHEEMEAASDPELNAWIDSSGQEIGDKCAWQFGPTNARSGDVTSNGSIFRPGRAICSSGRGYNRKLLWSSGFRENSLFTRKGGAY